MQNVKKNYYFEFLKDYHSIKGTCKNDELPKLLLHVCCGACSSFPLPFFVDLFDITIYFTNSNIYPAEEFNLRLSELGKPTTLKPGFRAVPLNFLRITALFLDFDSNR